MNRYMDEIHRARVERGGLSVWWLGQNGFVFKTWSGVVFSVDAYLTNSCEELGRGLGLNFSRAVPVLVPPEAFDVDFFVCTHSHQDHADPATIQGLPKKDMEFIGPGLACEIFEQSGVHPKHIRQVYAGGKQSFDDVTIHGVFALPTDDTDLNHLGYVIEVKDGPRVYMTGDTDYHELLASVAKMEPQLVITCINGGFNNLSHWEAADLVRLIKPRAAIPCHYDMFPDNQQDPERFAAALRYKAPDVAYCRLEHMKQFVFRV